MRSLIIDLANPDQTGQALLKQPNTPSSLTRDGDVTFLTAVFLLERLTPGSTLPRGFVLDAVRLSGRALLVFCLPAGAHDTFHAVVVYFGAAQGPNGELCVVSFNELSHSLSELDVDLAEEELKRVQVAPAVFLFFVCGALAESLLIEGWELTFLNSPLTQDHGGV